MEGERNSGVNPQLFNTWSFEPTQFRAVWGKFPEARKVFICSTHHSCFVCKTVKQSDYFILMHLLSIHTEKHQACFLENASF